MATGENEGVLDGIRADVIRLHETWMELLFPRQRGANHSVLGKWKPTTTVEKITYRLWSAIGVPLVGLLYPLLLVGVVTRFYSRRFDSAATRMGLLGVVFVVALLWGILTAVAYIQLSDLTGVYAVLAASVVAVLSAGLAYIFHRLGGRLTTVVLAYPFGVTAVFLPPVVAGYYAASMSFVFEESTRIAVWLLDNVLYVGNLNEVLRDRFELKGLAFLLMWLGLSFPVGWVLGSVVTLADLVRPKDDGDEGGSDRAALAQPGDEARGD